MVPAISIVIPAHNEENYIRQTLHSLKNQSFQDFEVIVVANGCVDKTEEIVRKRESEKFKLFSMSQANVSRARNYGADKSESEILLFLDADTTLEQDALHKIHSNFSDQHTILTTKSKPDKNNLSFKIAFGLKNLYASTGLYKACSGALVCRKSDFEKINGYNPEIIVREHHNLISELNKLGKYHCLDTTVTNSTRRYEQWGVSKSVLFWTKQWFTEKFGDLKKSEYEKIR